LEEALFFDNYPQAISTLAFTKSVVKLKLQPSGRKQEHRNSEYSKAIWRDVVGNDKLVTGRKSPELRA